MDAASSVYVSNFHDIKMVARLEFLLINEKIVRLQTAFLLSIWFLRFL